MALEHLSTPVSAIGTTTAATRRSSWIESAPQAATMEYVIRTRKAKQAKLKAVRLECSKGRRCGVNTLGERGKCKEEWLETENVQKLNKIRAEGLEAWDWLSYFNAKKSYLLKARENPDRKIRKNELVATLKELYKNECNVGSLDDPVWTGFLNEISGKSGDGVKMR